MKKGIITQSNYIPWKGYFDSIRNVDVFVVYDDMQYTKRDWRNRNIIKTPQGLKWLTIPVEVKGKYFQKIIDTRIADLSWNLNHINLIKENYKNAPHYPETIDWLEPLYRKCNFEFLTDVNLHFINEINKKLSIKTEIILSKEFDLHEEKTQRLVEICKSLDVTDYYSGPAAKAYMDVSKFKDNNINVHFWNYSQYIEYQQINGDFEHGVSIIDLFMNLGDKVTHYLSELK